MVDGAIRPCVPAGHSAEPSATRPMDASAQTGYCAGMIRRLYDWTMGLAAHRHAPAALTGVAFVESSVFPIPPDVMLVPMVLAERLKAWRFAALCTIGSVLGGIAGYAIGYFLFELVGAAILDIYDPSRKAWNTFTSLYETWGFWIVFAAGFSPLPYKVFTIASGVVAMNFPVFVIASVISRGARFFLVAGLLYYYGEPIRAFIERRLGLLAALFVVLLIGGFVSIKYLI